jgi:hypothetical protein
MSEARQRWGPRTGADQFGWRFAPARATVSGLAALGTGLSAFDHDGRFDHDGWREAMESGGVQVFQFICKTSAEDWPAAPGLGIEVFVVDVETRGVTFAFPLIATEELKESLDPCL